MSHRGSSVVLERQEERRAAHPWARAFYIILVLALVVVAISIVSTGGADLAAGGTASIVTIQQANSSRWMAMGEAYRPQTAALARGSAASAARWQAMGARYEPAAAAHTSRWQAMGEWYSR